MYLNQWSILKDTSELDNITRKKRNTLFFGIYEFCATVQMPEAFVLRHKDHATMDKILQYRRDWGRKMSQQPGSWLWSRLEITDDEIQNLHSVLDWILAQGDRVKIMVSSHWLHVYTNEQKLAEQITASPQVRDPQICQVQLIGDPDAVNLKKSDYTSRTYLRWSAITLAQKQNLRTLLRNQTDIRISPGLDLWLYSDHNLHLYDHHFIDHNDSGVLTLLALALGRVVRKTLPIRTY